MITAILAAMRLLVKSRSSLVERTAAGNLLDHLTSCASARLCTVRRKNYIKLADGIVIMHECMNCSRPVKEVRDVHANVIAFCCRMDKTAGQSDESFRVYPTYAV